jgi:hypothetical protein
MPAELESIQINLNSKFANQYINGSHCNVVFDLPSIEIQNQHHIHLSVVNAIIPYSFYNVNDSNNILMYVIDNVLFTINISQGNYNSIQLASYLQSHMQNFTVQYNAITNKFLFKHSSSDFELSCLSTCLKMLGLILIVSTDKQLHSYYCSNLSPVQCLHIQSNFLTGNINSSSIYQQNTICTIPVNAAPNSNIVYENNGSVFTSNLFSNILNDIVIKIVDQDNNILNLNGLDWSITIQLDIIDFVN